jgi:hypothetical protein
VRPSAATGGAGTWEAETEEAGTGEAWTGDARPGEEAPGEAGAAPAIRSPRAIACITAETSGPPAATRSGGAPLAGGLAAGFAGAAPAVEVPAASAEADTVSGFAAAETLAGLGAAGMLVAGRIPEARLPLASSPSLLDAVACVPSDADVRAGSDDPVLARSGLDDCAGAVVRVGAGTTGRGDGRLRFSPRESAA